jgi:MinD-like ATPase involved in chromosome partitioning or flagellar assembly
MQVSAILRGVPLFAPLEDDEIERVSKLATVKGMLAGTPLFEAGDVSDSLYVIARGRVKITIPAEPGVPEKSISLGGGKFFGEMGLVAGSPRSGSAVVEEDAVVVRIGQTSFDQLMTLDTAISEKVMAAYLSRVASLEERKESAAKSLADPKSLLFFGTGGGAGASFLVCNAALQIRNLTQQSVLVLDLDIQTPSQHLYFGITPEEGGVAHLLPLPTASPEEVRKAAHSLHFGVDLLGGSVAAVRQHATPGRIVQLVRECMRAYDVVLIDTTSSLTTVNQALFGVADSIHLVFAPDIVSVSRAVPIVRWLDHEKLGPRLRLVLNKFQAEAGYSAEGIEKRFQRRVLGRVEFEPTLALGSVNEGVPLVKRNPRSTVAVDLTRFARQIVSHQGEEGSEKAGFSLWNLFS